MFLRGAFAEATCLSALRLSARWSQGLYAIPLPQHLLHSTYRGVCNAPTSSVQAIKYTQFQDAIHDFYSAVTSRSTHSARPSYNAVISCLSTFRDTGTEALPTDLHRLQAALALLAQHGRHEDSTILSEAAKHMAELVGVMPDKFGEDFYLRLLAECHLDAAFEWLSRSAEVKDVAYASDLSFWHRLLRPVALSRNYKRIAQILRRMKERDISGTQTTSFVIFSALFLPTSNAGDPPHLQDVKFLIKTFVSCELPYHPATLRTITSGYTRAGMDDEAGDAEMFYILKLGRPGLVHEDRMNRMLADLAKRESRDIVARVYQRLVSVGLNPSYVTFKAVLGISDRLGDLKFWETVLGIKASPYIIADVMERRAKANKPTLDLYNYALSASIPITSRSLRYTVRLLLTSCGLEKPSEKITIRALELYNDFLVRWGHTKDNTQSDQQDPHTRQESAVAEDQFKSTGVQEKHRYPDVTTYQLLLRAVTSAKNALKYLPVAVSLVEDMRRFQVELDSQTASSVVILLMESSPSPEEAFQMYRAVVQPDNKNRQMILNEEGYVAIIDAFSKLPTWSDRAPSVHLYLEILSDMRKHSIALGPKTYTLVIAQLARLATKVSAEDDMAARETVAKAIARIHNHLNLNPSFTPDTALWNQLMDAYQRAGCFAEACRIWQMLFTSARFNRASVSVILDACAYAQAYDMAVRVYGALNEVEFPMNVKNWNTYLECLCRLGRLDEAMKVLCLEMTGRTDGVEPDKESARILLKFAMGENREGEVRSRLKRFLPKLYHSLLASS
ncbi:hypothetical protein BC628DRAFT_1500370 [Trametes gibbosa]|nr:hypothetical protein BC628DRAFT_1500370 [Trametes gibbosa]